MKFLLIILFSIVSFIWLHNVDPLNPQELLYERSINDYGKQIGKWIIFDSIDKMFVLFISSW